MAEPDLPSPAGRLQVKIVRGRIVPCDSCGKVYRCAMYQSFTRNRLRSQYLQGTNILHSCDIYTPNKIPQNVRRTAPHGRTSGQAPT